MEFIYLAWKVDMNSRDLGLVCLSVESISKKRKFRPLPAHNDSVQSTTLNEWSTSSIFYADPNLLLPSIGDNMTEGEFIVVLESILTRIENAVEVTAGIHKLPADDSSRSAAALLEALRDEGVLNVDTLNYISSVLGRF